MHIKRGCNNCAVGEGISTQGNAEKIAARVRGYSPNFCGRAVFPLHLKQ